MSVKTNLLLQFGRHSANGMNNLSNKFEIDGLVCVCFFSTQISAVVSFNWTRPPSFFIHTQNFNEKISVITYLTVSFFMYEPNDFDAFPQFFKLSPLNLNLECSRIHPMWRVAIYFRLKVSSFCYFIPRAVWLVFWFAEKLQFSVCNPKSRFFSFHFRNKDIFLHNFWDHWTFPLWKGIKMSMRSRHPFFPSIRSHNIHKACDCLRSIKIVCAKLGGDAKSNHFVRCLIKIADKRGALIIK